MTFGEDRNCMSFWLPPLVKAGLPVPETRLTRTEVPLMELLDGELPAGWEKLIDVLRRDGDALGWPCFMRTGHGSGKHQWEQTCFVPSRDAVPLHVGRLVEWSSLAGIMGLPTGVWAMRRMLPVTPLFTCAGYGNMPVVREFRFFVRDGTVEHVQPYWPPGAVEEGRPDYWEWPELLAWASDLSAPVAEELSKLAVQAVVAVGGGFWSVDLLQDCDDGWWITDMALGDDSFRWER